MEDQIGAVRTGLQEMMAPASALWIGQRLASLFVLFNPTRAVDDRAFRIWNDEMTSLLIDLPHDILAFAIDEAIRESTHGFAPSIGEIRAQAKPLLLERSRQIERLTKMEDALADPEATAARIRRRAEQAAHEAEMAKYEERERRRKADDVTTLRSGQSDWRRNRPS